MHVSHDLGLHAHAYSVCNDFYYINRVLTVGKTELKILLMFALVMYIWGD